jgi:DNA-directed RNA polymerase subunit L
MASKIADFKEEEGILTFTIYNTDVSYVNALRRTILSDIPIVVFKTIPYEENKANIMINTSRLNNEIVKQRLGCIPICASELEESQLKNYLLEVDVENKTDTNLIVTTKDFKIKNLVTDKYLDDNTMKKIFPPYIPPTGNGEYYIDFLRLRPNITKELPGERIKLTCELSISNARYDSMFNVVGTCAYGCTPDREKMAEQLEIRKQKWKDEGKTEAEIKFEAANWNLLEGLRYVKSKSFDFIIQSLGIYENTEIIIKSCNIVIDNLENIKRSLEQDEMEIKPSINTMDNSYDITLVNNDYTIGNILNYELYSVFYQELKALDYVGFKKMHPHDNDSIIRVSVTDKTKGISAVKTMLNASIEEAIQKLESIKGCFNGSRK